MSTGVIIYINAAADFLLGPTLFRAVMRNLLGVAYDLWTYGKVDQGEADFAKLKPMSNPQR